MSRIYTEQGSTKNRKATSFFREFRCKKFGITQFSTKLIQIKLAKNLCMSECSSCVQKL